MANCILCKSSAVINRQESNSRTIYNCPSCGVYVVSDLADKEVRKYSSEISTYLTNRRLAEGDAIVLISYEKANLDKSYLQLTVEQIVDMFPKNFTEQMDMVLKNLELMSEFPGDEVRVEDLKMTPIFYVKKSSFEALSFVIKSMQKVGLVDVNYYSGSFFPCGIVISPNGWDRLAEIHKGKTASAPLFARVPRGENGTGELFLKAVRKAARECDLRDVNNSFTSDLAKVGYNLISAVKSSKIVVCDLTDATGEAYYTAALAQGLGKICILTCHESMKSKLQIDTNQFPVIIWNKYEELYLELLNIIKARI